MLSVLRTLGRAASNHPQSCVHHFPDPNEIRVGLTHVTRAFSRKSKGKVGSSRPRVTNEQGLTPGQLLLKPALFAAATSTCAFSLAAILKYEDYVSQHDRQHDRLKEFHSFSSKVHRFLEGSDVGKAGWRQRLSQYWARFSVGEKMAMGCVFLNACVFAGWKSNNPAVRKIMYRYFTASVYGKSPCASMLLSTFSHTNLMHLVVNMICVWSFAPNVVNLLGKEQAVALYVSAGMSSSLASYLLNALRATTTVSIGASGAILGLAGAVCTQFPDAKLAIIFLPMFPIAAKYALGGLICMDTAGVILGWKVLDHAGHLGGTLFGAAYILKGHHYILQFQKELLKWWDTYR